MWCADRAAVGSRTATRRGGQSAVQRCSGLAASVVPILLVFGAAHAADLASLHVIPMRDQSADDARRDRYECHNWAVGQTGAQPVRHDPEAEKANDKAQRVDKVITGAAIGAAVGGILRGRDWHRDAAADGALGGAVLGAAAGAIAGQVASNRDEADPDEDYLRALAACMEGRGYELRDANGEAL